MAPLGHNASDAVKELAGTLQANRARVEVPALRPQGQLVPPPELDTDPRALAIWRDVVPDLQEAGILGRADLHILALYCLALARAHEAAAVLAGCPVVKRTTKDGSKIFSPNPAVIAFRSASLMACRLATEFGLSPASRFRLHPQGSAAAADAEASKSDPFLFQDGEPTP